MLRFDGLYVTPPMLSPGDSVAYFGYLRFYADGEVIDCSSRGRPDQVIRWFDRDNPDQKSLLRGSYHTNGDEISFSPEFTDQDEGQEILMQIDYEGHIKEDGAALELSVVSRINGYTHQVVYRFAQVSASMY
jgi:hypothetical protein